MAACDQIPQINRCVASGGIKKGDAAEAIQAGQLDLVTNPTATGSFLALPVTTHVDTISFRQPLGKLRRPIGISGLTHGLSKEFSMSELQIRVLQPAGGCSSTGQATFKYKQLPSLDHPTP